MFKRKILKEFEKWMNGGGKKKALVVKGMCQIGKTFSVLEFARSHYKACSLCELQGKRQRP
ncbi:hypothetical protein [Fibrobacter sp.]|uniref:hypothetical protein n=1 Tax=Fibrobacter sp. TaxID=35828 RepID=UPI0025C5090E|nr:hypothetical protein [Fibrobacter sp.]MBR3072894.1 hypothetical protein [Fibrobacter sp.]